MTTNEFLLNITNRLNFTKDNSVEDEIYFLLLNKNFFFMVINTNNIREIEAIHLYKYDLSQAFSVNATNINSNRVVIFSLNHFRQEELSHLLRIITNEIYHN
jgi:hypothetical protein